MNNRSEIRGTIRAVSFALLRSRQALLQGIEDGEVMLTPSDMDEIRATMRECTTFLNDIKKLTAKFGEVADMRTAIKV